MVDHAQAFIGGGVGAGGTSIACASLPAGGRAVDARGEVDVPGAWTGGEVAREPLWESTGARIRA